MKQSNHSIEFIAGEYVTELLTNQLSPNLLFHNLHHTFNVVRGVRKISKHLKLSPSEKEILILAAWFHDTGHIITYDNHEVESQKLALDFLEKQHYPIDHIKDVLSCIEATKMPQEPQTLIQKVICDADLYHLSLPEYPHLQHLLREEWSRVLGKKYSNDDWAKENFEFLTNHKYFTSYGQKVLRNRKSAHLDNWKRRLAKPQVNTAYSGNWNSFFLKISELIRPSN